MTPTIAVPRRKKNDPGALGAELTAARAAYNDTVSKAASDLAATNASVVERGTQRIADLRALEEEARAEREATEEVVASAK